MQGALGQRCNALQLLHRSPCGSAQTPAYSRRPARIVRASAIGTLEDAKADLLDAVFSTRRGTRTTNEKRGAIEELQVDVERHQADKDLDYDLLGGLWRLQYTTATDVLPILEAGQGIPLGSVQLPSPISVGGVYQRFTSPINGEGTVENVLELSVPFLTEDRQGVTVTVHAQYEVRSGHRIVLAFEKARVSDVRISALLETLIAPAILPRNPVQLSLLLGLKQFELTVPFRSAAQVAASLSQQGPSSGQVPIAGGAYQLTYLDDTLLIGRAVSLGGSFIFTREQE